jgi:Zn-dependent M28 family amino/carboxypeptidase
VDVSRRAFPIAAAALVLAVAAGALLLASRGVDRPATSPSRPLEIDETRLAAHLGALQRAADENGGNRASATPGYDASIEYVSAELRRAGYEPVLQRFTFPYFAVTAPPRVELVEPRVAGGLPDDEVVTMAYSPSGAATGRVAPVDVAIPPGGPNSTTSGCEESDFDAFPSGAVALVQRGRCFLFVKARNAEEAGASAVVVFNEGQPGRREARQSTLGRPGVGIPVVGVSYETGRALAELAAAGSATVRVTTSTEGGERETANVVAELRGSGDERVVVGGHLDSVASGPGLNDNGSGVAALLEIARELRRAEPRPRRTVTFAFWAGEELGLFGSQAFVERLDPEEQDRIVAVLNLDMLGSRNGSRFVYDGDGSETEERGPEGSDEIERLYLETFRAAGLSTDPTAVTLASDHAPFAEAGIAVGGVYSGSDESKSPLQAREFGGRAGEAHDRCYHRACDTFEGVDLRLLAELAEASAAVAAALARGA